MTDAIIKAVVESAMANGGNDYTPQIIVAKLSAVRKIEEEVDVVMSLMEDEEERHEAALVDLDNKLRAIRKRCGHEAKTYHGDPSGGSDSCHTCDICGAEL